MGWEKYVGRVGALAVALGIGSAVASLPGVAWADSGDSTSAGVSAPAPRQTVDRPAKSLTKPKSAREDRPARKRLFGGAKVTESETSSVDVEVDSPPVADDEPPVKKVVRPLFHPRADAQPDKEPESPAAAPLLLTMLGTARQHVEERRADRAAAAATSSSVQVNPAADADPADTEIRGVPDGPVVVGSTGTIYQVTTDADGTRVSIVDRDGRVITTSDAFPDAPVPRTTSVARPDGSVVVITVNDRRTRSTVWSVNEQGDLTKITMVRGFADAPKVGADGSLYFGSDIPFFLSPIGFVGYRTFRISPTNTVRTYSPQTRVTVAPDGSVYLLPTGSGRTLRAFGADGTTRTVILPGEIQYGSPIVGEDGYLYLPVPVQTLFGGKTTRLYTMRGTQIAKQTLTGVPGSYVVKNDGVYLETYTYSGTNDLGDGNTYIYKITPTAVADPRFIEGRLKQLYDGRRLQVSADGTIYALLEDPDGLPVLIISPDGTSRTTIDLLGDPAVSEGDVEQADNHGYFTYASNGTTFLAVLNGDGSIDRTIELPAGTKPGSVFFGPDGAAYLLNYTQDPGTTYQSRVLLTLSNDTFSPVLNPGSDYDSSRSIQFGPDGSGYLLLRPDSGLGVKIVGFDASGLTGTVLTVMDSRHFGYKISPDQALAFAADGTAYLATDDPAGPAVYALTKTGAAKVLDLAGTPPASGAVIAPDGTLYVTTATADGFTIVRTIAPPTAV
ncbi:hypothetical protein [Mycobacterium sp. PSTR-4-N]|uniref:hypothetical protein n=1 Tax=Mycobacterium sp. PSTR-4-N TaxID=2917745 RepID=UPI001F15046E|nr:hypothetical protein [Mycobacterium sp. PSTR-4-N]MCG7595516.1 hypothetical protein [Mycobacterium sp. PSTR-4-N]